MSDKETISKQVDVMFANSPNTKVALERLAGSVPKLLVKSLISSYLKFVTILIDGIFKQIGIIIEDPSSFEKNLKDAKHRIRIMAYILNEVLKDPVVRAQLNELALNLNDSVLRPFLIAAVATMEELGPSIDEASNRLHDKTRKGFRKLGDAVIGAAEDVIGTTPYIGNVWNATSGIANALQGVQAVVDTSVDSILEATLRVLMIMQKVQAPGMNAVDSFIDFAINGKKAIDSVKNKVDSLTANLNNLKFEPEPLMNKQDILLELNNKAIDAGTKPAINNTQPKSQPKSQPNAQPNAQPKIQNNVQKPPENLKKTQKQRGGLTKKKHHKKRTRQRTFKKYS